MYNIFKLYINKYLCLLNIKYRCRHTKTCTECLYNIFNTITHDYNKYWNYYFTYLGELIYLKNLANKYYIKNPYKI